MRKLLFAEEFSDVDFYCQDNVIPAHRIVLCMGSQFFCKLFVGSVSNVCVFLIGLMTKFIR